MGGRERLGRGKRQHIHLNLAPLLATLSRLHCGAHHCLASSRQSLFHCANSAPWKDCKNKWWMSKAEVNRISPFFCQAGEVCTNTSLRDREERRALRGKEPEKLERLYMKRPMPWEVACVTPGSIEKTPPRVFGWKTPKTHRRHYTKDTRSGMMTYGCKGKSFPVYRT